MLYALKCHAEFDFNRCVQYLQYLFVFSIEKGSNGSSSDSDQHIKHFPQL